MAIHVISYDLKKPGRDYTSLIGAIKKLGPTIKPLESFWLLASGSSCVEIRDHLKGFIDTNDSLFVAKLTGEAAWTGISKEVKKWIEAN